MELVNSVLSPSSVIKRGFETITVELDDGRSIVGLLVEETDADLVLRNASDGSLVTLAKTAIVKRLTGNTSTMPADLVNQITSRQQFLDLVRYLIEIREGGSDRARELRPPASLIALATPEYEARVDHAGMIRRLDDKAFESRRGDLRPALRQLSRHAGAARLAADVAAVRVRPFKNGSDPYAMYQTLTHGYGLMAPQTWMVPRQKYDVIHYIREAYLRRTTRRSTPTSDAALPGRSAQGRRRFGPAPPNRRAVGDDGLRPEPDEHLRGRRRRHRTSPTRGSPSGSTPGPAACRAARRWTVFDHDTLRFAAAWTGDGFIDWNGIHFNGRHRSIRRSSATCRSPTRSAPAGPTRRPGGSTDDRRVAGRDGRRYGPLPRTGADTVGCTITATRQ